jgi:hypothetical protein
MPHSVTLPLITDEAASLSLRKRLSRSPGAWNLGGMLQESEAPSTKPS